VQLAVAINQQIEARSLSQIAVAELLCVNQPKVSALQNYKLDGFSVARLMTFLTGLGSDIEIRIRKPKRASNRAGRISVESASSTRNRRRSQGVRDGTTVRSALADVIASRRAIP
jgi:predicted XRE-type DNA-binding protein